MNGTKVACIGYPRSCSRRASTPSRRWHRRCCPTGSGTWRFGKRSRPALFADTPSARERRLHLATIAMVCLCLCLVQIQRGVADSRRRTRGWGGVTFPFKTRVNVCVNQPEPERRPCRSRLDIQCLGRIVAGAVLTTRSAGSTPCARSKPPRYTSAAT